MTKWRDQAETVGAGILLMLVVSIAFGGREYARIKLGPLFILDAGFAAVIALGTVARPGRWQGRIDQLWGPMLFAVWGALRLALDLAMPFTPDTRAGRMVQHSILFVYPAMWTLLGAWLVERRPRAVDAMAWMLVAVCGLPNLIGQNVFNISLGPLLAVLATALTYRAVIAPPEGRLRARLLALVCAVVTFAPFWIMWLGQIQRTTLGLLVVSITGLPWLLRRRGDGVRAVLATIGALYVVFALGLAATIGIGDPKLGFAEAVRHYSARSLQHGEDIAATGAPPEFNFPARFRRFCWERTLSIWSTRPVLGVGTIPEIPDWLDVDKPNIGPTPVVGPHNSYLTVLARLGVIGAALLALLWISWARVVRWPWQAGSLPFRQQVPALLLVVVPINGALHAVLNVGYESPHHCMILWLWVGMAFGARRIGADKPRSIT